jgi:DNA-binding transcriptional regulator YhcF (GntR family)
LTATSADGGSGEGWFVAVVVLAGCLGGVAEGTAEEVDGVALEAEADVGVHGGGDTDVGVPQQLLDHARVTGVVVGRGGRRSAGSGVPLTFEVIAEALRERVRSGGLQPGDALPTQAVLMREFGASSLTVQKAMTLLKQDGWAVSRPGKGAFVAHHDHPDDFANDLDGPGATAPANGTTARVEALERALAEAVQQIADLRGRVEALESDGGGRGR